MPFDIQIENSTIIGDFFFDYGLQYQIKLKNDWKMTIGLVYSGSRKLNAKIDTLAHTYISQAGTQYARDTLINRSNIKGKIKMPTSFGGGFVFSNNNFMVGADVSFQNWSQFKYFGQTDSLVNSSHLAVGMQYTPDPNTLKKYYKKIQYRLGFNYTNTFLQLKDTKLTQYGFSVGLGLPIRKSNSMVNIAFEYGQMGTMKNNLIKENYGKIVLGFSLYDIWFLKQKYY